MNTQPSPYAPGTVAMVNAFDQGWKAHDTGKPLEHNPFILGVDDLQSEWDDGWYAAAAAKATRYGG